MSTNTFTPPISDQRQEITHPRVLGARVLVGTSLVDESAFSINNQTVIIAVAAVIVSVLVVLAVVFLRLKSKKRRGK